MMATNHVGQVGHTHTHKHTHVHTFTRTHVHTRARTHTRKYTRKYTRTHVHTRARARKYTHTHNSGNGDNNSTAAFCVCIFVFICVRAFFGGRGGYFWGRRGGGTAGAQYDLPSRAPLFLVQKLKNTGRIWRPSSIEDSWSMLVAFFIENVQ